MANRRQTESKPDFTREITYSEKQKTTHLLTIFINQILKIMKKIFSLFAAVLLAFVANAGNVIDINNGTPDALRKALESAGDGDEIVMAEGTYVESPENYLAFTGKSITVRAAEGKEVILQPQVPIRLKAGATAKFVNIKFDCGHLGDVNSYENLIVPADENVDGKTVILDGCEFYGWTQNAAILRSTTSRVLGTVTVNNCYIHNINKSFIFLEQTSEATVSITNSTFANVSTQDGYSAGVIDVRATSGSLLVDHCTFYDVLAMNTDYAAVGKVKTPTAVVSNCIFALSAPGASSVRAIRDAVNANNVLVYNYTTDSNWGMQGNVVRNDKCINDKDPKFKDAANGDFTLSDDSPALGAGTDESNLGDPRWFPKAISAVPTEAAPVPTWPADQVKSIYSDTYTFAPASLNSYNEGWWDQPTLTEEAIDGNKFLHYNGRMTGMIGWQFADIAVTIMEYIHVDIWASADATIKMGPTSPNPTAVASVDLEVKAGKWTSFDIPISALIEANGEFRPADVFQNQFTGYSALTDLSVDNVFFYRTTPYVDETAPTDFTAAIDAPSFFSATIKAKASDESGAVAFTVKNGDEVVATGAAASGTETIISVANLKPATKYDLSVIASDDAGNAAEAIVVEVTTLEAPAADAAPAFAAEDVKSFFSDAYEPAVTPIDYMQVWWKGAPISRGELAEGDNVIFYGAADADASFGWAFELQDLTDYPYLHMSIYPLAAGTIEIYPVQKESNEALYHRITETLVANQWNNLDFDFSELELTKIQQIGWCNYSSVQGFFVDNVFFSKEKEVPTAIDNAAAAVKAKKVIMNGQLFIIRDGEIFNAQGQSIR